MKNQLMVRDGSRLIALISDNFFINYDDDNKSLEVRFGKECYTFRNVITTTMPDGKSIDAVSRELANEIPVFKIADS